MNVKIIAFAGSIFTICMLPASCVIESEKIHTGNFEIPDSLQSKNILAIFQEPGCVSLIINSKSNQDSTLKLSYFDSGQVMVDSLLKRAGDNYYSIKLRNQYIVKEKTVQVIHEEKIIHPSSNWQGQSPWKEVQRFEYPRLD